MKRRTHLFCATLITLLSCLPHAQALELPDIGDTSESYLSLAEEQRLGAAFMRNLRGALSIVNDAEIDSYITSLGERLATNSGSQQPFTFFVVNDPTINAFAGPGGYIGINTGLIMASESESELASVVAHEIAHVTQRHLARAFESATQSSLPTAAAIIAAIILANQGSDLGEAAFATALASSTQKQINFTRQNEKEADRIGISLLASSDFDPQGMPSFFERLYRHTKGYDNQNLEFLRTHPLTISRISDTRNRAAQYPAPAISDQTHYQLIKTRLQVFSQQDNERSITHFKEKLDNAPDEQQDVARYGYALSLAKSTQYSAAMAQLKILIQEEPERINYQVAAASVALSANDLPLAAAICQQYLKLFPHHHALTSLYALILLKQEKPQKASALLYEHLRRNPLKPQLYKLLAQAEYHNQKLSASHEALAEFYYLNGVTRSAIEQLKIALGHTPTGDSTSRARIAFRRDQLEKEELALAREK